jgi:putative PIN family toxin of toxin-antitoxin system
MRVLLDANIFISYLLPTKDSETSNTIHSVVDAGFAGKYTLVFPQELLSEMRKKTAEKPYLVKHIVQEDMEEFIKLLISAGEMVRPIAEKIPAATRDVKDDYLIAYTLIGECDYLVTGDEDLLDVKEVGKLKIVSPSEFQRILHPEGR